MGEVVHFTEDAGKPMRFYLVIVRMGHFVGMQPGTADLRRAEALLMGAIPERKR